jgi:EpsI family protein
MASDQPGERIVAGYSSAGLVQRVLLSLGALGLGPALAYAYQPDSGAIDGSALSFPQELGGWRVMPAPSVGYRPVFDGPDMEYVGTYRDAEGSQVYLYLAEYAHQEQGKEAVSNGNSVYDNETWKPVQTRTHHVGDGAVRETRIQSTTGAQKVVWQWYYVHGFSVSSSYAAKLLNAWGTLNRDPAIAAVVVATDLQSDSDRTAALLTRFVAEARPAIERSLDQVRRR